MFKTGRSTPVRASIPWFLFWILSYVSLLFLSQTPPIFQKLHHFVPAWRAFQNSEWFVWYFVEGFANISAETCTNIQKGWQATLTCDSERPWRSSANVCQARMDYQSRPSPIGGAGHSLTRHSGRDRVLQPWDQSRWGGEGELSKGPDLAQKGSGRAGLPGQKAPKLLTILLLLLPTFPWLPYKIANIEPSLDNTSLLSSDFNSWKLFKSMGNLFHISFEGKVYFKTRIH